MPSTALSLADLAALTTEHMKHPLVSREFIHRHHLIPLDQQNNVLRVAIADPTNHAAIAAIGFQTGLKIEPLIVSKETLSELMNHHVSQSAIHAHLEKTLSTLTTENDTTDEPISRFVNELLSEAIQKNISDIHIEPNDIDCRIRFRRDGLLYEALRIPLSLSIRIITRLKLLANLNIAEHRLPQDGRIKLNELGKIDIRMNCCPMLHGEKIVLRLLNNNPALLDIHALGMSPTQINQFIQALQKPQGLILVTGPTGSGKTMTLYAALHFLNDIQCNISTAEDPIEIELGGINQIQVNPKIGLDFPTVLRAFLRQDPDILMIGEIRDRETAQIAIQAAQTGHLVLSTLHTNSAADTLMRLQHMNIESYQLTNALSFIIAQRLIRKLCQHCKIPDPITRDTFQASGCEHCHQGYHERTGMFECIPMTPVLSELILARASSPSITNKFKKMGYQSLHESGIEKVRRGETSYTELARVTGECA